MENGYNIALNLLPLSTQEFGYIVYRREYKGERREGVFSDLYRNTLPIDPNGDRENRAEYWISFEEADGLELCNVRQDFNHRLTQRFLFWLLKQRCSEQLREGDYKIQEKFRSNILFTIERHPEGNEVVWLEPYYLSATRKFGFLIDFSFMKNPNVPFSRRVQQLSLSLDKNSRRNSNFYIDRYEKLQKFMSLYSERLFSLSIGNVTIGIEKSLQQLPAERLAVKKYVFANEVEGNSQFMGVKRYGPLECIPHKNPKFYFVYHEKDRGYAQDLFLALKGKTYSSVFSGMESMFNVPFENENITGRSIESYTEESLKDLMQEIKSIRNGVVLPVIHISSRQNPDDNRIYHLAKGMFINEGIPLQFITLDTLKNRQGLKWSVSNIGLQMFAKLGGSPWKVRPRNEKCLIIGVGQCHDMDCNGRISKYYAYSVLTDSSGLYKDLKVLSRTSDRQDYIKDLQEKLKEIITAYKNEFTKIVIHTPFKIRRFELETIKKMLEQFDTENIEFVVLKVNTVHKFFGYSLQVNSLVPYESTFVKLSPTEYIVWFEGLQYHNPTVYKLFAGPAHIEFYYESRSLRDDERKDYLQDTINLSGANWRGFNAKSLPVSIYYCKLVADFIKEFKALGYENFEIDNLNPWFL